jgi:TonB-dependent SusC/RagA subfamily outer membrane receptor
MRKFILFFLILPVFVLAQQQVVVKGTVLDEENKQPLPGASVLEKGTSNGVVTDFDGIFEINTTLGATLSISYVGLKTQEIVVDSETVQVYLQTNLDQLDEVVVSVGYFDVSKKDLSGSISQVTTEKLEQNRTSSVEQLLQGQVSGVVISDSSEPGGGTGISIRGTNSLLGGTQPLYVVDGIPIDPLTDAEGNTGGGQAQNSIAFLNPNDIDKIEVLKDAAATAIYGARGANGVIIITTKSADTSNGKDSFTVNIDSSVNEVIDFIDVLDGPQFESYMNQRALNQLYVNISNPDLYIQLI